MKAIATIIGAIGGICHRWNLSFGGPHHHPHHVPDNASVELFDAPHLWTARTHIFPDSWSVGSFSISVWEQVRHHQ